MNISALEAAINRMDSDQVGLIRDMAQKRLDSIGVRRFRIGDLIEFTARGGNLVRGTVARVNAQSISGMSDLGGSRTGRWRAHPSFCRLVGADKLVAKKADAEAAKRPYSGVPSYEGEGAGVF